MTRVFDAPRELVFDAFTKSDIMKRWLLAPEGWSLAVCDIDLSVGGACRYVWCNGADRQEFVVSGVYTEDTRPARVVHTEQFDDLAYPDESLQTWTTMAGWKRGLESGMEQGTAACYDRLAALLGNLANALPAGECAD